MPLVVNVFNMKYVYTLPEAITDLFFCNLLALYLCIGQCSSVYIICWYLCHIQHNFLRTLVILVPSVIGIGHHLVRSMLSCFEFLMMISMMMISKFNSTSTPKRVIQCLNRCRLPCESKQSPLEKNIMVK